MTTAITEPRPSTKPMTAAEFYEFVNQPENEDKNFELVRGMVVEMSRPKPVHGFVQVNIAFILKLYAKFIQNGCTIVEVGLVLGDEPGTVYGPDVAFYSKIKDKKSLPKQWFEIPPDLVVEVLSDSDRPGPLHAKVRVYLNHGVKVVWLVDCDDETVTIFKADKGMEIVGVKDRIVGGDELPGFDCAVRDFFYDDQSS